MSADFQTMDILPFLSIPQKHRKALRTNDEQKRRQSLT